MTLDDRKARLFPLLQTALQLELSTIPPYLTALLSLKRSANRVAADIIRSVMMEEMLHMILVGNLMSSLGGRIRLGRTEIPRYPLRLEFEGQGFQDREFEIDLMPFSAEAVRVFMQIELPAALVPAQLSSLQERPELEIPALTIGGFYQQVIDQLQAMCRDHPEADVFCGDPARQIGRQHYWAGGGEPIIITSMDSARQALDTIISQGEGGGDSGLDSNDGHFRQPAEVAHYFRFRQIAAGRFYQAGDDPRGEPSGRAFVVDPAEVQPVRRNARSTDYAPGSRLAVLNEAFNRRYSLMLFQLEQAFAGTPSILHDAILNGMHGMTPIALEMMSLPIEGSDPVQHGAPTFEWIGAGPVPS